MWVLVVIYKMSKSKQLVGSLLRGLTGRGNWHAALTITGSRQVSSSATALHVQAAPIDDIKDQQPSGKPRWLSELGAIRTDWT